MTEHSKRQPHPKRTAGLASLLTFFYTFDLFKKGYTKDLHEDDLYEVLTSCKSNTLGDQLEQEWEVEKRSNTTPSLIRVLCRCFGKRYLLLGLVQLVLRTILVISIPEPLGKLISYYTPGQTQIKQRDAYYYAACVIILTLFNSLYNQNYLMSLTELAIRMKAAVCSLVFRKALKMTEKSLSEISMGKIVTLITKDVNSIEVIVLFGNELWIGLVQAALITYLSYNKVGAAAFAGLGFGVAILPLQVFLGKLSARLRLKTSKKTDERIQLTQELLSNIKSIKMYTWECFYRNKIKLARRKELQSLFKLFFLRVFVMVIGSLSTKIAFYFLVMTHVWLGYYFTAEMVYFVRSSLFNLMVLLSVMLPLGAYSGAEFSTTSVRLRSVLHAEEVPTVISATNTTPSIYFNGVVVKTKGVALTNITMQVKPGLNVVVGRTGSGKTTLIKAILGEVQLDGSLTVNGSLSYAGQKPWLFPSTIKNNIVFGEGMDHNRYHKVLELCDLNQDLRSLPSGDNTLVSDNLSVGQQSRINLARAVYKQADIYLLDDCLSALDSTVSDHIFKRCILNFLRNKVCLLVCNNGDYIGASNCVISVNDGRVGLSQNSNKRKFKLFKKPALERLAGDPTDVEVYQEEHNSGAVNINTYKKYVISGGGYIVLAMITLIYIIVQAVVTYSDQLVNNWVTLEQTLSDYHKNNITNSTVTRKEYQRADILNVYTITMVASTGLSLIKALSFFNFNRRASISLHKLLLCKITNAKMSFFDSHPVGNVLNRFSKDLSTIDETLPQAMNDSFEVLFMIASSVILVTTVNYVFLVPAGLFFAAAFLARFVYLRTSRSLYRLEAATRSPMIGHLHVTLRGLSTIRAMKAQQMVIDQFDRHQDLHTSATYSLQNSTRALAFVLDSTCSIFITIVILRFVLVPNDTPVGDVGMAMSQGFYLSGILQYFIIRWSDCENQMTSVERVFQYTEAEQEDTGGTVLQNWPTKGEITYENVSLQYKEHRVLNDVSFTIKPRQKVCVVGRTGAGKSSIVATLFRLYDTEGAITIDNVNIKELSLDCLRSNIAIVPQDPVLISAAIRENIDPYNNHPDCEIWRILDVVNLKNVVENLTDPISDLSGGQKQLVCLARAVIGGKRIVVLDEPTASLDNETDWLVQSVIQAQFGCCTLVVVAHKRSSILSSDVVMVVDEGRVVEVGRPRDLMRRNRRLFSDMGKHNM